MDYCTIAKLPVINKESKSILEEKAEDFNY